MKKKTAQVTPNQLLRRARLERGWTQKIVAERIGAPNDVIVTRWERGTAFPSPYYVERLCQLFEQRASNLGLLKDTQLSIPTPGNTRKNSPNNPIKPSAQTNVSKLSISALPMIGRETNIDTLKILYQHITQGQTQVVLIQGEAGIGKTHLASAFLNWAVEQGATLLQGRSFEMGGRLPYQPLVHAFSRRLEEEQTLETVLDATWLSELSRILPELRERYPYLPLATGDEMAARVRLFEAVTRLGQAFCSQTPIVLFIDDLHWADEASLDVLHYAGQRWSERGMPLLLLFSARSEALAPTSSLRAWFTSLYHDLPVTEIPLGPLTLENLLQLLSFLGIKQTLSAKQRDCVADLGKWLFRETHGQPFYLVETINVLIDRQILIRHHSPGRDKFEVNMAALEIIQPQSVLSPSVRQLIQSQLERLSTMGHALLMGSAILGKGAPLDLLCLVANVKEDEALAALDEVLWQGLLREASETGSSGPYYLFGHDKIREVVITGMSKAHQQILHNRTLKLLKDRSRPASELAHHALAAGMTKQAVHFSLMAGDNAVRLFANTEACLHYTQALAALTQLPMTTQTRVTRIEAILKLVQISWMNVEVELSLERLAEAEQLAQILHDKKKLACIHYWIGVVYSTSNAMHHARNYVEQALAEAQDQNNEELVALASVQLSRVLIIQGWYRPIKQLLPPIIPILERTGNWQDWVHALGYLGVALTACGRYAEGLTQSQRAVEHTRRAGKIKNTQGITARHYLSIVYLYGGDLIHMLEENVQVVAEAEELEEWLLLYWAYGFRSWAQSLSGKYEEAMQSMAHAQAVSQKLGTHIMGQDIFEAVTAKLLLATGQVEEALVRAQTTIEMSKKEVGGILAIGMAERVWGQALAHLSRWDDAEVHLTASLQAFLSGASYLEAAHTQVIWGLLCRDHGDRMSAQAHFKKAAAQFEFSELIHEYKIVQNYLKD